MRQEAARRGIVSVYENGFGQTRRAPIGAVRAMMDKLRDDDTGANVLVLRPGSRRFILKRPRARVGACRVELEDGDSIDGRIASADADRTVRLERALPMGCHRLLTKDDDPLAATHLIVSPASLSRWRDMRDVGLFLPWHAMRANAVTGMGSISELRSLARWTQELGGSCFGTLPLYPAFLDQPFDPSPYAPVTRLAWNELLADLTLAPEWEAPEVQQLCRAPAMRQLLRSIARSDHVDYAQSWKAYRQIGGEMTGVARRRPDRWEQVCRIAGRQATEYARFRAVVEQTRTGWKAWDAKARATAAKSEREDGTTDFYLYTQSLVADQMRDLRADPHASTLYLDLPVSVHPDGFDAWKYQSLFLADYSCGAPPDGLNAAGQSWGIPPMHPTAGRADCYAYFRAVLQQLMSVAGVVRLDHVMGLERMYVVPPGYAATEGMYIRYPAEELFSIVKLVAARNNAVVVGEDLGTVSRTLRRRMMRHGVLGMHVQQFAMNDADERAVLPPEHASCLLSLNTHDTPTFAGFWNAADIDLRQKLRHIDQPAAHAERVGRRRMRSTVSKKLKRLRLPAARKAGMSLTRLQARSDASLVMVNLEDLWGERRPHNVPGTTTEFPNWRRRAAKSVADINASRPLRSLVRQVIAERPTTLAAAPGEKP